VAFIALVITLLLEQFRPLPARTALGSAAATVADAVERNFNAGQPRHGVIAWFVLVGGAALATYIVYVLAASVSWFAALAFDVLVLYLTMGFRQFSHRFTEIRVAANSGDLEGARRELVLWKRIDEPEFDATSLPAEEVIRQALEHGLLKAQRHVFGVLFWFAVLGWAVGPVGPVVYRLADYVARRWSRPPPGVPPLPPDRFGDFARRAFAWIDWAPARFSALGFAVVGDFEATVHAWREAAARPGAPGEPYPDSRTLLLAAASGALGIRLLAADRAPSDLVAADLTGTEFSEPAPASLSSGAALLWRAVLLWLILLLLLSVVSWAT
jgi:adenosylcobinamide-phosphate synthase